MFKALPTRSVRAAARTNIVAAVVVAAGLTWGASASYAIDFHDGVSNICEGVNCFGHLTGGGNNTVLDANGMPMSLQVVAKYFDEVTMLRVAAAYETATPWRDRRPAVLTRETVS